MELTEKENRAMIAGELSGALTATRTGPDSISLTLYGAARFGYPGHATVTASVKETQKLLDLIYRCDNEELQKALLDLSDYDGPPARFIMTGYRPGSDDPIQTIPRWPRTLDLTLQVEGQPTMGMTTTHLWLGLTRILREALQAQPKAGPPPHMQSAQG